MNVSSSCLCCEMDNLQEQKWLAFILRYSMEKGVFMNLAMFLHLAFHIPPSFVHTDNNSV